MLIVLMAEMVNLTGESHVHISILTHAKQFNISFYFNDLKSYLFLEMSDQAKWRQMKVVGFELSMSP